jgi:hypothetical protein
MKYFKALIFLSALAGFMILIQGTTFAQKKGKVENVDFFLEGDNLIITYDIEKAKTGETFNISINVSTVKGTKINAFSLSGDVGPGVYGGKYKRIAWDLAEDNVYIDDEIFVEVIAEVEGSGKSGQQNMYMTETRSGGNKVSVGGAMLRSLVFPGWGNSYAKGGGAYWLMGVAAYGAAGAAVYFNNEAYNNYEDYKLATDPDERDQLYQDASDNHDMQKNLMIAAGAIWVVDIIWTGIQAGNVNKKANQSKVSMGYYYDPVVRTPMFSVSLKLD